MVLICIIGLPRSGTTLLGRALADLPGARYHEEPNPMWRYQNWRSLGHEQFDTTDATPEVRRYIRSILLPAGRVSEDELVIEKTPANCIRLGFVGTVVPEARFIFLTRNGNDIRQSMLNKWRDGVDSNAVRLDDTVAFRSLRAKLAKSRYIHPSEKFQYLSAELKARWSVMRRGHTDYWGPMVLDWQSLRGLAPEVLVDEVFARMQEAFGHGMAQFELQHTVIAYEDMVRDPQAVLQHALTDIGYVSPNLEPALKRFKAQS